MMRPSVRVIRSLLNSWHKSLGWTEAEVRDITRALVRISLANGGRVYEDSRLTQRAYDSFFRFTVETAVGRAMRECARELGERPEVPYRLIPTDAFQAGWPMVAPRRPVPRIDLNRASARKLAEVGELSVEEASKIVQYRRKHGPFSDLVPLAELVGKEGARRLQYQVYVGVPTPGWQERSRPERHFVRFPTFKNYLKLLLAQGKLAPQESAIKQRILAELDSVHASLLASSHPKFHPARVMAASEIARRKRIEGFVRRLERRASRDLRGVTLLDRSQYLRFMTAALAQAQKSILVIMFFVFRGESDQRHPTEPLFSGLIEAVKRGVDVKLILDKDGEGDVFNSRNINKNAAQFLVSQGIPVSFTTANKVIHSKVVLIDDRHVIVGSHNWTAGSFYRYDDKSLYLESEELARALRRRFERLWHHAEARAPLRDRWLGDLQPELAVLKQHGIVSVEDFLARTDSPQKRQALCTKTGVSQPLLEAARRSLLEQEFASRFEPLRRTLSRRLAALERAVDRLEQGSTVFTLAVDEDGQGQTLFYLLNQEGHARPLPTRLAPDAQGHVQVCLENRESKTNDYQIRISGNSGEREEWSVPLGPGERHVRPFTFGPFAAADRRIFRLDLFKASAPQVLYGALQLAVEGSRESS